MSDTQYILHWTALRTNKDAILEEDLISKIDVFVYI